MLGRIYVTMAAGLVVLSGQTVAQDCFFGPSPYLSADDIPIGFYSGGPTALEDFEDGVLDFGIDAPGELSSDCCNPVYIDSVDADDGVIDAWCVNCDAWFDSDPPEIHFTFSEPLPTAAAVVWTDGEQAAPVVFEAFGAGMVSLGMIGPFDLADSSISGTTAEDRFFGVISPGGIYKIRIENQGSGGIEVDHVQYGDMGCPWDLDGSGDVGGVGVNDFLILLADWGEVGVPADFDGDGVGVTDFLILLAHWGPCP